MTLFNVNLRLYFFNGSFLRLIKLFVKIGKSLFSVISNILFVLVKLLKFGFQLLIFLFSKNRYKNLFGTKEKLSNILFGSQVVFEFPPQTFFACIILWDLSDTNIVLKARQKEASSDKNEYSRVLEFRFSVINDNFLSLEMMLDRMNNLINFFGREIDCNFFKKEFFEKGLFEMKEIEGS